MARPKSDDKRSAILAAATRVLVRHGLSAATAAIAKEAGVANGSLFTYFATKDELFNQLYLELKQGMAAARLEGLSVKAPLRQQFARMWSNWMRWAMCEPDKRRALALLGVSDDISPETRAASHAAMARVAELLEQARAGGPMAQVPMGVSRRAQELAGRSDDGLHGRRPRPRRAAQQGRVRRAVADAARLIFLNP